MTIKHYNDIEQGTPEWHELRRGILTASEVSLILTPSLAVANNDKVRSLVYKKAAEIITGKVQDTPTSWAMERGHMLEPFAISEYEKHVAPVKQCGFITNDRWGFKIGYSPDGLVGKGGLEIKSPSIHNHMQYITSGEVPKQYIAQVYTGILVGGLEFMDFMSYHPGVAAKPIRVKPDAEVQQKIIGAATEFYAQVRDVVAAYKKTAKSGFMTDEVDLNLDGEIEVD